MISSRFNLTLGKTILDVFLIPTRRDAPRFERQPQGVRSFTAKANREARSARLARQRKERQS